MWPWSWKASVKNIHFKLYCLGLILYIILPCCRHKERYFSVWILLYEWSGKQEQSFPEATQWQPERTHILPVEEGLVGVTLNRLHWVPDSLLSLMQMSFLLQSFQKTMPLFNHFVLLNLKTAPKKTTIQSFKCIQWVAAILLRRSFPPTAFCVSDCWSVALLKKHSSGT